MIRFDRLDRQRLGVGHGVPWGWEPVRGGTVYSNLNASTGSSLAALAAGYKPNPTPVMTEAPSAAMIAQRGTTAGIGVILFTRTDPRPPSSMPTAPPTTVSVAASTRNCHRISRRVAPSAFRT